MGQGNKVYYKILIKILKKEAASESTAFMGGKFTTYVTQINDSLFKARYCR